MVDFGDDGEGNRGIVVVRDGDENFEVMFRYRRADVDVRN